MKEPKKASQETLPGGRFPAGGLVSICVACDETGETARWAASLRADYRRFPALRAALDRA